MLQKHQPSSLGRSPWMLSGPCAFFQQLQEGPIQSQHPPGQEEDKEEEEEQEVDPQLPAHSRR